MTLVRKVSKKLFSFHRKDLQKELLVFLWLGIVIFTCRFIGSMVLPVYDDAFITFRYAKNFAVGNGFVYNISESVLGTTSPAFGVLCTLFYLLSLPMPQAVIVMNIFLDLIIFYLTIYALPHDKRYLFSIIFGVLFSVSPIMNRICIGGMEANLFLACSIISILLYLKQFKKSAIILASISYFLRPEALILIGLLCAKEWVYYKKTASLKLALIAILTLAFPLMTIFHFYGQIISSSIIAKATMVRKVTFINIIRRLLIPDLLIASLMPLATFAFIININKEKKSFVKFVAIFAFIYVAAYLIARPQIWSWYGEVIYYSILLLATLMIMNILEGLLYFQMKIFRHISLILTFLPIATWIFLWAKIGPSSVTSNVYRPLQAWCKMNIKNSDSILAEDIGAIGYYSNAYIYDLEGLVWPKALSSRSREDIILSYLPDYLFLVACRTNIKMMDKDFINKIYKPIARFSRKKISDMSLDPSKYSQNWDVDYIIFKKVNN